MNPKPTLSSSEAEKIDWDTVVIGAGIAGAIAAREIARTGCRVLLVDKRTFPRRKVCGACLNDASLEILDQLELRTAIQMLGGQSLHQFSLYHDGRSVHLPLPGGLAVSREVLDAALVTAAIEAGVDFLDERCAMLGRDEASGRRVRLVHAGDETSVLARSVVVATGLGDVSAADSAEWTSHVSLSSRIGLGCTISDNSLSYASGTIWMAAGKGGYVGLVRVEDNRLNLAAAFDRAWIRAEGTPVAATLRLLERSGLPLPSGLPDAEWQGTLPLTRSTTPVASGRTFLIGDAAGYVEPFTGEGMMWALLSGQRVARWVVDAVRDGSTMKVATDGWRHEYKCLIQTPQRFCRFATTVIRSPQLLRLGIHALSFSPWFAKRLAKYMTTPRHPMARSTGSPQAKYPRVDSNHRPTV